MREMHTSIRWMLGASVLSLLACEPPGFPVDATETSVKLAGVGLNPEEIAPSPNMYGGVIEYDWVNFAGGGLPLGLMGLVSYDAVGADFATVAPPYAMVYGLAFIMDSDLPATDTLFGTFGVPSDIQGACYTNYEPRAYLNNTADVGTKVSFTAEAGDFEFNVGRRPLVFAKNNSEALFTYYMDLGHWQSQPLEHLTDVGDGDFSSAEYEVLRAPNWQHGARTNVSFAGGIPPEEAPIASIPVPLAAAGGDTSFNTPNRAEGVMLSWVGNVYDHQGNLASTADELGGEYSTCLQYLAHEEMPGSIEDCLSLQEPSTEMDGDAGPVINGQLYTGPWETEDGLHFSWEPGNPEIGDIVSISVRFLGPVDEDDKYKQLAAVDVPPSDCDDDYCITEAWKEAQSLGYIDESDDDIPDGIREAQSCEEEGEDYEWEFDKSLLAADGDYQLSLQGEPTHTLSELTCNVPDNGEFTLTADMLIEAMDYADRHDAGGAIFYFSRTTATDLQTPDVRDRYDQLREVSDVRLISSSVELGRFWWDQ
jgi:hypothetical protein